MTVSQAKALFDEGRLGPAIEELTREVKAEPSDTARRTFLFEVGTLYTSKQIMQLFL